MNLKYAAFDMDGTLLDTMPYWRNVVGEYAKERGCKLSDLFDPEDYMRMTVMDTIRKLKSKYPDSPVSEITVDDVFRIMGRLYSENSPVKSGVKEMLEVFRQKGVKMCVITATRRKPATIALKKAGLLDYFDFMLTPDEYPKGKVTTDIFLAAAEKFGCDIKEIAMFEDALYSICTAKKLGMYIVGVADDSALDERDEIKSLCNEFYNEFSEMNF